ncbi:MAG: MotA/TolQ/ExbB proton channel family protein [Bacteroidales bacterium]|nr:MotA/TolQ/ExbB proton channel family protein [Bacteroidales bacterium]MCF8333480.1 MotA/TolQ/ExbB proton channel family protein [Bacteroidales bacterium]
MEPIISKMNDGGILITWPILILLILILALFVKEIIIQSKIKKTKELIASIGWFVIAWGYLGRTIGLIGAFDNVAAAGKITPELLSGGLKMALVGPLMALVTFAIARLFIIVFILTEKENSQPIKTAES